MTCFIENEVKRRRSSILLTIKDEKERKKRILNHLIYILLRWNLDKETKPAITKATEDIWREYLSSNFYKHGNYKDIDERLLLQRRILDHIYKYVVRAYENNGFVQYSRNKTKDNTYYDTKMKLIDFCESIGMFVNIRSDKKPNPARITTNIKQSRLVPLPAFFETPQQITLIKEVYKEASKIIPRKDWVIIKEKINGRKVSKAVDWDNVEVIRRLSLLKQIHKSWLSYKIWYKPLIGKELDKNGTVINIFGDYKLLPRNQPFCSFTRNLSLGGRIYTRNGITTLKKEERATIVIEHNSKKLHGIRYSTIELDIKNQHPFLIYAIKKNINYQDAAYDILTDTELAARGLAKDDFKELVKVVFSAAINSKNCVSAAKRKADPAGKSGKKLEDAEKLTEILARCQISFSEIYKLLNKKHPLLKDVFHRDRELGLKLQKIDSDITLLICGHFARKGKLCLPIHDSYIVADQDEEELREVIKYYYEQTVKYSPRIEHKKLEL